MPGTACWAACTCLPHCRLRRSAREDRASLICGLRCHKAQHQRFDSRGRSNLQRLIAYKPAAVEPNSSGRSSRYDTAGHPPSVAYAVRSLAGSVAQTHANNLKQQVLRQALRQARQAAHPHVASVGRGRAPAPVQRTLVRRAYLTQVAGCLHAACSMRRRAAAQRLRRASMTSPAACLPPQLWLMDRALRHLHS